MDERGGLEDSLLRLNEEFPSLGIRRHKARVVHIECGRHPASYRALTDGQISYPPSSAPRLGVLVVLNDLMQRHAHRGCQGLSRAVAHLPDITPLGIFIGTQEYKGQNSLECHGHFRMEGLPGYHGGPVAKRSGRVRRGV